MSELLQIADELYGLDLAEFTPVRDARAKALKGTELGKQVKALRKPATAAWVVNLLVRHETEQVDQVLAVGAALREAQASMSGDELRALTRQRRQLTAAVTTQARGVAKERGLKVTPAVADQIEATLTAAMVDEGCADAVRSGLLVTALTATGVDEVDLAAAVAAPEALGFQATARDAVPVSRPELHVVPDPDADAKARAAAEDLLESAQEEVDAAQQELDEAAASVTELEARALQLQGEMEELRRRLAELETTAEEVDDELSDAEDARSEAETVLEEATHGRDAARAALDRLS
ncbi:hypothetical protein [Nocardioides sp. W7]|uniref:hypothetical protein n=1 Tax=Nocardioides sp. W7 TaxID=2931390 RepID=UPI001FD5C9C9|nr:hypothetical protein [Nocardioides sp. W7]